MSLYKIEILHSAEKEARKTNKNHLRKNAYRKL